MRKVLPLLAVLFCNGILFAAEEEKVPLPQPYIFSLGGLTEQQLEDLKSVPGIKEAKFVDSRAQIVFQPYNDNPWFKAAEGKPKWIKGAESFYDYLPIKKQVGSTKWSHGGMVDHNAGSIIMLDPLTSKGAPIAFGHMFDDLETGRNEIMRLICYSDSEPGQLEHEMLRGLVGEPIKIEKCGNGYAVVAGEGRQSRVVWQVSAQAFVRVDFCFDREMIAAYIGRLGGITPSDYKVSVDQWVEEEIRWRIKQLDLDYEFGLSKGLKRLSGAEHLTSYFPETGQKYGDVGSMLKVVSCSEIWQFLYNCRNFLWANRHNFKSDLDSGMFVLKGKDLYDPKNPPELPEELRGPPKPTEEQIHASEVAAQEKARENLASDLKNQIKNWNDTYQAWVVAGSFHGRDWGYFNCNFGFVELENRMGKRGARLALKDAAAWLEEARGWLWANRENFEYRAGGYYLKGPDRYDPKNPPELPPELIKTPEKPAP